ARRGAQRVDRFEEGYEGQWLGREVENAQDVLRRRRAGDDDRVEGLLAVAATSLGNRGEGLADALRRLGEVVRVHAHVELREMEAEELDAASQSGERALGDSRS